MSETHEGYLLIADITGYTQYLSESELEHAQDTLTALLELLVENTRSPLIISRLAGDAVISYGLREDFFQGQPFIEKTENTYVAFRKALERLVLNNTCQCNACANISNLDLKFFIHYGTFGIQRISDHDELIGSDINLLHRLLKNSVTEQTGFQAYALYTEPAIRQLDVEDLVEGMTLHSETHEHLGEVEVFVQDMHRLWKLKRKTTVVNFPHDELMTRTFIDINMPHERVWDYMIQPEFRNTLVGSDRIEVANRKHGRIAPGSVYQCYHGENWVPQTILEWYPFERMLVRESAAYFSGVYAIVEYRVDPTEEGTRLTKLFAKPTGSFLGRAMIHMLEPVFKRFGERAMEAFKLEIENDFRAHSAASKKEAEITETEIRRAAATSLRVNEGSDL